MPGGVGRRVLQRALTRRQATLRGALKSSEQGRVSSAVCRRAPRKRTSAGLRRQRPQVRILSGAPTFSMSDPDRSGLGRDLRCRAACLSRTRRRAWTDCDGERCFCRRTRGQELPTRLGRAAAGRIGGRDGFKRVFCAIAPGRQSLPMTVPREPCGGAPPKLAPPIGLSETKVDTTPGELVAAAFQIAVSLSVLLRR